MPDIVIGDVKFHYVSYDERNEENADLQRTMVFLLGGAGMVDHTLYIEFWSRFKDIAKVIFVDLRGCGKSEDGDDPEKWTIDQQAKDVYKLCQALKIEKPIIAGVSWGGYIAQSYAIQYPDNLEALILCNTEAKVEPEYRYKKFLELGGKSAAKAVSDLDHNWSWKVNAEYLKVCLPFYAQNKPYTLEELGKAGRKNKVLYEKFFTEEHNKFDFTEKLHGIKAPVLQLAGGQDPVHPAASAKDTNKAFHSTEAKLVVFKGAGDTVYRDEPKEVEQAIRKFYALLPTNGHEAKEDTSFSPKFT